MQALPSVWQQKKPLRQCPLQTGAVVLALSHVPTLAQRERPFDRQHSWPPAQRFLQLRSTAEGPTGLVASQKEIESAREPSHSNFEKTGSEREAGQSNFENRK